MDTLTHALSGALLARATAPPLHHAPDTGQLTLRARMTAGFLAAAFPDADFVLRAIDTLTYVTFHRGITHSIILLPFWAWLVAWVLSGLSRLSRRPYPWRAFYGIAALGIGIHVAGDVITSYGTMLLAPFSRHAFSVPFTFIIDPYFTGIIVLGLVASIFKPKGRYPAVAALLILGCYVGFQGILHSRAVEIGEAYVEKHRLKEAQVHAFPQPLSPFNWKIVVSDDDDYEVASVNLWRTQELETSAARSGLLGRWEAIAAGYQPVSAPKWTRHSRFGETERQSVLAREAWRQEIFAGFRHFAVFPALDRIEYYPDAVCVSFLDLRFIVPSLQPSLVFGLCREGSNGSWQLARDRGLFGRD
jgi:inner membrane protein